MTTTNIELSGKGQARNPLNTFSWWMGRGYLWPSEGNGGYRCLISRKDLKENKRAAGSAKDIADVESLEGFK